MADGLFSKWKFRQYDRRVCRKEKQILNLAARFDFIQDQKNGRRKEDKKARFKPGSSADKTDNFALQPVFREQVDELICKGFTLLKSTAAEIRH